MSTHDEMEKLGGELGHGSGKGKRTSSRRKCADGARRERPEGKRKDGELVRRGSRRRCVLME